VESVEQALVVLLPAGLGVGRVAPVTVIVIVSVAEFFLPVSLIVVEPVDVLEFVAEFVAVGVAVSVIETTDVLLRVNEMRGVCEARSVPVIVGEELGVLDWTRVRDPDADRVAVFDIVVLPVLVLDWAILRESVADPVGDFVEVMVRLPLVELVPVFDDVLVAVEVIVPFML